MTLLRSWGIKIVIYIDDIVIMADTAAGTTQYVNVLIHVLQCLGFIINFEKPVMTPMQELEFLGMMVNTITLRQQTSSSR